MSEVTAVRELRPQFRLRSGRDDALIQWLASMQPRRRSDAIRGALQAYLVGQQQRPSRPSLEPSDLAEALDSLFSSV
jgi:hypothetical protein